MNSTTMTRTHQASGVYEPGAARVAGMVSAVGGASDRWPWPLPVNSVPAVFDDRAFALSARTALIDAGIGTDAMWQVSGEAGARWLRQAFAIRGAPARLLSLLGDEHELLAHLERLSLGGAVVMLVRTSRERLSDVVMTMEEQNAQAVRRTGRWTVEWRTRARNQR